MDLKLIFVSQFNGLHIFNFNFIAKIYLNSCDKMPKTFLFVRTTNLEYNIEQLHSYPLPVR